MQEKTPGEKKPEYPETGKEGGQGDIGKKGGDAPPPERPVDEPTELPGRKPEPKQVPQPTI